MHILVTGSNGQLGHEMARYAATSADHYTFTDVAELDITDRAAVLDKCGTLRPEVIVNCAAYTNVDKAEDDEATARLINATAVGNLAAAAKAVGATLIHVSTDYVFAGDASTPYIPDAPTHPTGAYGRTKLEGEQLIRRSGCRHIILRTAWLYSAWGNNFLKTMLRLTVERDTLGVVFDQIGTPTAAADLADAIGHIITTRQLAKQGTYHFTDEGVCSWYDFTVAIAREAGNRCDIRPIHSREFPSRVARPHYSVLDKTSFRDTFSYRIPHWTEALVRTIQREKRGE